MNLHLLTAASFGLWFTCNLHGAQYKFPTQTLTVPDGFEVEQVAGPPVVERPITGSLDEEGRFYVTDSSGSNDKVEKQLAEKPHRVLRLDSAEATGHFTRSQVFADRLMFPEGCLWFDGSLYVSAPPSIWKLTDTNGDGRADQRSEWHQGKTLTGCANDLHGPYLGLDGWIYWCKGAFAQQTYPRPGRAAIDTRASHIFRAPADHSDLEPVITCGMDNPVGVVFSLEGERFMCGTFLMHPEAGKRDGVVHAVYGGIYGKPNDVLDGHPKTGDLMPIMTHLGAAAPCSLIRYDSDVFGTEYRDNLFVCCFNLHKITRHVLAVDGATFKSTDSDFLVSDNPDFHPTDVIEDADGSLIVIDTGAWYKLCCPTSQLSKPDVLGAIYRIRRSGAANVEDPRGLHIEWNKLDARQAAHLLDDPRTAVRKRALVLLSKQKDGVSALTACLNEFSSPRSRANVVWGLTRITSLEARAAVRTALADPAEVVKHAAIQSIALWRDKLATRSLLDMLPGANPSLQRVIAEALGRLGDKQAVPALLAIGAQAHDRVLEHSLTYALIELDAREETARGLGANNPLVQRMALVALDQMQGGALQATTVSQLLSSPEPRLRQTAMWIAKNHPDWGSALKDYFNSRLYSDTSVSGQTDQLQAQLATFAGSEPIQDLIGTHLLDRTTPASTTQLLLRAIAAAPLKEVPASWLEAVARCLGQPDENVLRAALAAARTLNLAKSSGHPLDASLTKIASDAGRPDDLRLEALSAMSEKSAPLDAASMSLLLMNVDPAKPVSTRQSACSVLVRARLSDEQLGQVSKRLRAVSPLEATRLLEVFEQSTNSEIGTMLVDDLQASKSRSSLRVDTLQRVLLRYPQPVQAQGKELIESLQADLPKQRAHLEELMASIGKGDIRRGQLIFNSQKAACSSCHAMGYLGGHVGPDLTSIGQVRTERDLLESIVYPSASFVRSFEPYVVRTKSDDEYSGVLRKDAANEIILATGPTTEVRIDRAEIADMRPGTVSVMPAGLEQQLSRQELGDLVAFLKATKWGAQ